MSPGFGSAGVLAHKAALVNWETNEKVLSELVLLKTRLNLDLNPDVDTAIGTVGTGIICRNYQAN